MDILLQPLDDLQRKVLRAVGCTEVEALKHWNLAPLAARRDMAMLGLVHRTVLGEGPAHFKKFFWNSNRQAVHRTRLEERRGKHGKQLQETFYTNCPELRRRSALGLVKVYNSLPAEAVNQKKVSEFQRKLQETLEERAEAGCEDWAQTFSPRVPWWKHPLR